MTCIVGLVKDGEVFIGGDSAGVGGLSLAKRQDKKVFKNGEFIFGFTSSFRMGQLLRYSLTPPKNLEEKDVYQFMVVEFVNAIRECLKNGGFARKDNETESGGTFLVGYKGRLFKIMDDYQVGEVFDNFTACGCGEDIALGSMFSSKSLGEEERILLALKAASNYSAGVAEPFYVESIK